MASRILHVHDGDRSRELLIPGPCECEPSQGMSLVAEEVPLLERTRAEAEFGFVST